MPTSGTYTFTVNRDEIIRLAMLNIGKLEGSEVPTAQEIADCSTFLNAMVKQWQGKADFAPGLKTWTRRRGHLFLGAAQRQYTLGPSAVGWTESYNQTTTSATAAAGQPVLNVVAAAGIATGVNLGVEDSTGTLAWYTVLSVLGTAVTLTGNLSTSVPTNAVIFTYTTAAQQPIEIESVKLRDLQGNDTPIDLLATVQQYDALPATANPTNISDPARVFVESQLGYSNLFTDVYGAADVTKHICITYMESIQDFNTATDTPEYPQEWYLALALQLSKQIAPMFVVPWTALQEANAKMALAIAQKKEPEKSVAYFIPGEVIAG